MNICLFPDITQFWLLGDKLFSIDIQGMLKNKVTKPYSPLVDGPNVDVTPKEGVCPWSPQQMPGSAPISSSFGSSSNH